MLLLHYTLSTEESSKNTFWTKRSKDVLTTIKDFKENQRILQILTGNMLKGKLKIRSNTSLQRKQKISTNMFILRKIRKNYSLFNSIFT